MQSNNVRFGFFLMTGLLLLMVVLFQIKANALTPKVPHLRNEMTTTKLQQFKDTVAKQAKTYPNIYFLEALDYKKEIALTFDDGPDATYTAQVLDVLKEHKIKATFFLVGSNIERFPDIVKRINAEGHAIGSHSYDHPDLRTLTREWAYDSQLEKTQEIFQNILGFKPAFYRPPYGAVTDMQIPYFAERGLRTINWSIDSFDWDTTQNSVTEITARVFKYAHEGAIILMHTSSNKANTVKSLPIIIKKLSDQGYTFKTIPDLLGIPAIIENK